MGFRYNFPSIKGYKWIFELYGWLFAPSLTHNLLEGRGSYYNFFYSMDMALVHDIFCTLLERTHKGGQSDYYTLGFLSI